MIASKPCEAGVVIRQLFLQHEAAGVVEDDVTREEAAVEAAGEGYELGTNDH